MQLFEKIKHGRYDFPSPAWDQISKDAKEVIFNLLFFFGSRNFLGSQLKLYPTRNPKVALNPLRKFLRGIVN